MDIADILEDLQLHRLSEEWAKRVLEEFEEIDGISSEYQKFLADVDTFKILTDVISNVKSHLQFNDGSDNDDFNWRSLVQDHDVPYKELLCVLLYFMKNGRSNPTNESLVRICLKAASLYFVLLTIPGSNAYFVFNMSIYEEAIGTLTMGNLLMDVKKSKAAGDASNQDGRPTSNAKLTNQGKTNLLQGLNNLLLNLSVMVCKYPLIEDNALRKTVFSIIALTRVDTNISNVNFRQMRSDCTMSSLTCNAYILLSQLCNPIHGKVEETLNLVLRFILPSVIMYGKFAKELPLSVLSKICNHAISFIIYLILTLQEESYESVYIFIHHLCMKVIDKAEYRQKGAESVVQVMSTLNAVQYDRLVKWLMMFAHSAKTPHRLFAVEVILRLLYNAERPPVLPGESGTPARQSKTNDDESYSNNSNALEPVVLQQPRDSTSHQCLLGVLFGRCHDSNGTVRTKALCNLAECMRSNNVLVQGLMKEIFVIPYEDNDNILNSNIVERGFMDSDLFLKSLSNPRSQAMDPLPGGKAVVAELLALRRDDKVLVRKAALQVLESIMKLNRKWMTKELVEVLCEHCRDPGLLIKKQMIQALTDLLLMYADDAHLPEQYVNAVLPQISNAEMKVQEKVLEVLQKVILQNLVSYDRLGSPVTKLPWKVLREIINTKKRTFFLKTCADWSRLGILPKNLVRLLKTHVGTENNVPVWMLFSCASEYLDLKDPEFAMDYVRDHLSDTSEEGKYAVVQALQVLGSCWKRLPHLVQDQVSLELLDSIRDLGLDVSFIGPVLDVVVLITRGRARSVNDGHQAIASWAEDLLMLSESYVTQNSPLNKEVVTVNQARYVRALVLVGDVAQLCPGRVKPRTAENIISLLLPEKQVHPELWCTPGLQALAVVTLGKICIQHEFMAKRIVPVIGNLLTRAEEVAVKVNAMTVLSDMCVRYTSMVEPLVPRMCLCLADSQTEVRYRSLVFLIRLLQQDYLKLRGGLFFHLLMMLRDSARSVRELINYYLCECLVKSHKNIMYHNIVECILYFNKYEGHVSYSHLMQNDDNQLFDVSGPAKKQERHQLYRFMCEHMNDEYRIKTLHKVCTDIFGGVVNNVIKLTEKGESVVRDAFFIMSCDELRLNLLKKTAPEEDSPTDVTAVISTAKKTLITQCLKQQVLEYFVPVLTQFRMKLGSMESHLLPEFRIYMRDLMKEYKDEINDIFSENKFLADEILVEIHRQEEEQGMKRRRQSQQGEDNESQDEEETEIPLLVRLAADHLRTLTTNDPPQTPAQVVYEDLDNPRPGPSRIPNTEPTPSVLATPQTSRGTPPSEDSRDSSTTDSSRTSNGLRKRRKRKNNRR